MTQSFQDIWDLEDSGKFDEAFKAHATIYSKPNSSYEVWKYYYFFLWNVTEEGTEDFNRQNNIEQLLRDTFQKGYLRFSDTADFNFIAGYTISLFPYQYGDYKEWEQRGQQMLLKATELDPNNPIYRLCYLGSVCDINDVEYKNAEIEAAPQYYRHIQEMVI